MTSTGIITASAWSSLIDTISAQVSVTTVFSALASVLVICIGFVFAWWGLRKVVGMVMAAFRKGKLSV